MQNSGLGNTVNPITSLIDPEVYNIPVLFMIGWRGEPGKKDEPQHVKMGKITLPLLDVLGVRYSMLPDDIEEAGRVIAEANAYMKDTGGMYALIVREGIFNKYSGSVKEAESGLMNREDAIKTVAALLPFDAIVVSTTGKISRELFEYRKSIGQLKGIDFMMVGAMGLASSFGAEIALQKQDKKIFVFDGDAAFVMSEGNLSTIGYYSPENLYHIVFDNGCNESTGGQPSVSAVVDYERLALGSGYKGARIVYSYEELKEAVERMQTWKGPYLLVAKVGKGSRKDLGRPTVTPVENKELFMRRLKG
jgi:phosphonopyruvate decarboxylase